MYWLLFNLARFPDVQRKLKAEIRGAIGSKVQCSLKEARGIEYLDAYVRESMRFCPTVPINMRVNYDEDIQVGEWTVPKGTTVMIPNGIVLFEKSNFGPDSHEFRPERFLDSDPYAAKAKRAFVAFGGHTRMCVGSTFAVRLLFLLACSFFSVDSPLCANFEGI